jgi:hypothetical protein
MDQDNNKDQDNTKVTCSCGAVIGRANFARHTKSRRHVKWEESIEVKWIVGDDPLMFTNFGS